MACHFQTLEIYLDKKAIKNYRLTMRIHDAELMALRVAGITTLDNRIRNIFMEILTEKSTFGRCALRTS